MGAVESRLGNVIQGLLMPKEAPDWYAGSRRKTAFPDGPTDTLMLLGSFCLDVPDIDAARQFYIGALGAGTASAGAEAAGGGDCVVARAGATEFRLRGGAGGEKVGGSAAPPTGVWPGHWYVWVADIRRTLEACEALGKKLGCQIVEDVHHVTSDDSIDVLVLQDPTGQNRFVVNQAPKGLVGKMRSLVGVAEDAADAPNLLGVIEAMHLVPSGRSPAVARFYQHFLGGAAVKKEGGYAVHFSAGEALRQTLYFLEEESHPVGGEGEAGAGQLTPCAVCMYMPSSKGFREAFERCSQAGILDEQPGGWEAAAKSCEFRVPRCTDPAGKQVVLELSHLIRSPEHPECPVKVSAVEGDGAVAGA